MRTPIALLALLCLAVPGAAAADEAPAVPPPPYSLPWQLRPVGVGTVLRSDTAIAAYSPEGAETGGMTVATTLLGTYKLTPEIAPLIRLGLVSSAPPELAGSTGDSAVGLLNPVLGGTYALALSPNLKLAFFLGLTVPIGSGGGNEPDASRRAAVVAGVPARSAMDNAMFAVNYFTAFPGVSFAYVQSGFTAQVEATVLELVRVRGEDVDEDASRTNFTCGLHLGYFVIPQLSIGGELRYQRWLVNDTILDDDTKEAMADTLTFAVGPRAHLELSDTMMFRPGIAYARGIDDPMSGNDYNVVQVDLPVSF